MGVVSSCDTCSQTCNGNSNGNSCQPVKIEYSANGMNLNVQIGCDQCSNEPVTPDPQFASCQLCSSVPYGRVAFGDDCSKFCECVQGKHTKVESCPDGLNYNANRSVCDFIENTNCSSVTTDNPDNCLSCENIVFGFVPFEKDCSKFCECFQGEINKVKQCNEGLLFNDVISNCDYPSNTTCHYGETTPEPITTTIKTTLAPTTYIPSTTMKPTTLIPSTTQLPTPTFDSHCGCGASTGYVPYNGSCTKYCDCEDKEVEECPADLYFDPKTTLCTIPAEVDCPFDVKTTAGFTLPTPKYGTTR